jgi:hypothetical protein
MIENVLHGIGGVGIFGVISICLFFAFFSGMLLWAAFLKRPYLHSMEDLPLEKESPGSKPNLTSENDYE